MIENNLQLLNYSNLWLKSNVLTPELLQKQIDEFHSSDDKNTEHYRYETFNRFLLTQALLSDLIIKNLFGIIKVEDDVSLATTMSLDILKHRKLTDLQFAKVANEIRLMFGDDIQKYIDKEIVWRQRRNEGK